MSPVKVVNVCSNIAWNETFDYQMKRAGFMEKKSFLRIGFMKNNINYAFKGF